MSSSECKLHHLPHCNYTLFKKPHITIENKFNVKRLNFFSQETISGYRHPGFVIRLILDGNKIKFEPDFPDFEKVFLENYSYIQKPISTIPRVETKLYSDWVRKERHNYSSYTLF